MKTLLLVVLLTLSACVTSMQSIGNELELGIDRQEVIKRIGKPESSGAKDGLEYMTYYGFDKSAWASYAPKPTEYVVVIKDNKVIEFGTASQVFAK